MCEADAIEAGDIPRDCPSNWWFWILAFGVRSGRAVHSEKGNPMNVAMNTYRKRTGPIRPSFAHPGMGYLGDMQCSDGSAPDSSGSCSDGSIPVDVIQATGPAPLVPLDLTCPSGQISDGAGGCIDTTLTPTLTPGGNIPIVDSSGVTWNCDANGNCCDPSNDCQQGRPSIASSAPTGASSAVVRSASPANQSAAQIVAALAQSVSAARAGTIAGGSVQCGNGVAVPAGQKCPNRIRDSRNLRMPRRLDEHKRDVCSRRRTAGRSMVRGDVEYPGDADRRRRGPDRGAGGLNVGWRRKETEMTTQIWIGLLILILVAVFIVACGSGTVISSLEAAIAAAEVAVPIIGAETGLPPRRPA